MTHHRAHLTGLLTVPLAMVALLTAAGPAGQTPQTPQRAPGTVEAGVRAVLVDVVVRDRRGQPVRDLSETDFEIIEDGVPQTIGSFTRSFELPSGTPAPPPPATGAAATASPPLVSGPGVTALVFDRLTPEARRLAVQAARSYLGNKEESADFVGIFGIDLALTSYAPFTRNAVALRKALDSMVSGATVGFTSPEQQRALGAAERAAIASTQAAASAISGAGGPGGGSAVGGAPGAAQLSAMAVAIERDFQVMERDQQGYATTNSLFAIVNTLGRIPGRKSLMLFSQGLKIPDAVQRLFLASSTPPTAPTSASTPWTRQACAPRASRR